MTLYLFPVVKEQKSGGYVVLRASSIPMVNFPTYEASQVRQALGVDKGEGLISIVKLRAGAENLRRGPASSIALMSPNLPEQAKALEILANMAEDYEADCIRYTDSGDESY